MTTLNATIEPTQAYQSLANDPRAQLIDVRTPAEYRTQHARGAKLVPLDTIQKGILPEGDGPIYVICQSGTRAQQAAGVMCDTITSDRVFIVRGGTQAWAAANLPVETSGQATWSLERQVRLVVGILSIAFSTAALAHHPYWVLGPLFLGAGLTFAALTNTCGMALMLSRMPWNR